MYDNLPRHPVTGLRALGHTRRGPIWPVIGGSGENDGDTGDAGADQTGGEQGAGEQQPNSAPAEQQPTGQQGTSTEQDVADDLAQLSQADLAKMVKDLRKENASTRANAKQTAAEQAKQDMAQQIGKALGLVSDDTDQAPDPDKLAEQLTAEQSKAHTAALELAVYKSAGKHGADADALTDSRAFLAQVENLDPADEKFGEKVEKAIKAATENNPRLRAQGQAPPRSSGQHAGGSGGNQRPASLNEALAKRFNN